MKRDEYSLDEYVINKCGKPRYKCLENIYLDWVNNKIALIDPNPPRSFVEYLSRLDYSLWFWSIVGVLALAILSIYASNTLPFLHYLRYILGSLLIIFVPGYLLVEVFYPEEHRLKPLERLALSIGLSIAVVPIIGLILNYTPWGISITSISFTLSFTCILFLILAAWRKYCVVLQVTRLVPIERPERIK